LNTKNLLLIQRGRRQESEALLRHALRLAQEHGVQSSAFRAQFNLAYHIAGEDRYEEAQEIDREGLELARRRGDRGWAWAFLGHFQQTNYLLGNWEDFDATDEEISEVVEAGIRARLDMFAIFPHVYFHTGRLDRLERLIERMPEPSAEVQDIAGHALGRLAHARANGRAADALAESKQVLAMVEELGFEHPFHRLALADALEVALELGDLEWIESQVEEFHQRRPADQLPFTVGQVRRVEALLAARAGESDRVEQKFRAAAEILREIQARFYLACVLLEHGEWLTETGRADEARPLLSEAREIFERLGAVPWLERLDALAEPVTS
jgi:tetratricopeptide (TPR) repeat protein